MMIYIMKIKSLLVNDQACGDFKMVKSVSFPLGGWDASVLVKMVK